MSREFTNSTFMRLFLAELVDKNQMLLDFVQLGKRLYEFTQMEKYYNLFQDFANKGQIKNGVVDMREVLEIVIKLQLLGVKRFPENSNNLIIKMSHSQAQSFLQISDPSKVSQMDELVSTYIDKYYNQKQVITNKTK